MKNQTFNNFHCSEANAYVIDTFKAIATGMLDPHIIFLYGPNSSGKTHLLHALQYAAASATVLYTTADSLRFDLVNAIRAGTVNEFSHKIAETDILLIDDAQFLAGQELTQEFLIDRDFSGTVVIAIDRELDSLHQLCAKSSLPFMHLELAPPDLSTQIKIVNELVESNSLEISDEVIHDIASKLTDIRQITGLMKTLQATKITPLISKRFETFKSNIEKEKT